MTEDAMAPTSSLKVQKVVVSELQPRPGTERVIERPQDVIRSVKVKVSVLLGRTEVSVGELFEMKDGDVLALDRQVDEPLELIVDGRVVARGELVVVGDSLGLRITEAAGS